RLASLRMTLACEGSATRRVERLGLRILRLRSQARFAQDDTAVSDKALRNRRNPLASYGRKGGPNAGSRASSPGEQAAACDCQTTRELGSARHWPNYSLAGLHS